MKRAIRREGRRRGRERVSERVRGREFCLINIRFWSYDPVKEDHSVSVTREYSYYVRILKDNIFLSLTSFTINSGLV